MSQPSGARPIEILLVEDDLGDVLIATAALDDSKVLNGLRVVHDGDEALAVLRGTGAHAGTPRPDLVLLDLGLPQRDGRQILSEIRADPSLAALPVVVLTSSHGEADRLHALGLDATAYITKPIDFAHLVHVVRQVDDLYLSIVRTAPSSSSSSSGS